MVYAKILPMAVKYKNLPNLQNMTGEKLVDKNLSVISIWDR